MKEFSLVQAKLFGDLITNVMDQYKLIDPIRYKLIELIKEIRSTEQVPPPENLQIRRESKG